MYFLVKFILHTSSGCPKRFYAKVCGVFTESLSSKSSIWTLIATVRLLSEFLCDVQNEDLYLPVGRPATAPLCLHQRSEEAG